MVKSIICSLLRLLLRPLFCVRVEGNLEQFSAERLLIVANHESFFDGSNVKYN